eukprot:scaffold9322_cov120-Isochrysis_galbana.AAC.4
MLYRGVRNDLILLLRAKHTRPRRRGDHKDAAARLRGRHHRSSRSARDDRSLRRGSLRGWAGERLRHATQSHPKVRGVNSSLTKRGRGYSTIRKSSSIDEVELGVASFRRSSYTRRGRGASSGT